MTYHGQYYIYLPCNDWSGSDDIPASAISA